MRFTMKLLKLLLIILVKTKLLEGKEQIINELKEVSHKHETQLRLCKGTLASYERSVGVYFISLKLVLDWQFPRRKPFIEYSVKRRQGQAM